MYMKQGVMFYGKRGPKIIAYNCINGYDYFATIEQYQGKGISIYIVCPVGVKELKQKVKDAEIITIYLQVDVKERYLRLLENYSENKALSRIGRDVGLFDYFACDFV